MNPWPLPERQPVFPSLFLCGAWKGAADCLHWPDGVRQKACPFLGLSLERHGWLPLHLHQECKGGGLGLGFLPALDSLILALETWKFPPPSPSPFVFFSTSQKSFLSGVFACVSDVGEAPPPPPPRQEGCLPARLTGGGGFPTPLPCHDPPLACKGAGGAHSLKGGQLSSLPNAAAQLREALLFGAQSAEQHKESWLMTTGGSKISAAEPGGC